MLVLFETAAGFGIFKVLDEKKLENIDNLHEAFQSPENANKIVQLQEFRKFVDTAEALQANLALNEGKLCKSLKKLLTKMLTDHAQDQLMVIDPKLGSSIKQSFGFQILSSGPVSELMRCIKLQVNSLIPGLEEKEMAAMSLGLGHNLARYKLKFSPDKVDTMIVQAICLLDDIDKELNNYNMKAREWYGWHFPELNKMVADHTQYIQTILAMGTRDNAASADFSQFLPDNISDSIKIAAEISMGTEIAEEDIINIHFLCQEIIDLTTYRSELFEYLINRMQAIAPNLTTLVGELVGARLIARAGSLMNLAKLPASTIQILGAEKALFSALKARKPTPKYGLIFHASLVAQSSVNIKGKVARMLAAKSALAGRYDALAEGDVSPEMAIDHAAKLSSRVRYLEGHSTRGFINRNRGSYRNEVYDRSINVNQYPSRYDSTLGKRKFQPDGDSPAAKKFKVEFDEGKNDIKYIEKAPGVKKTPKKASNYIEGVETPSGDAKKGTPTETKKKRKSIDIATPSGEKKKKKTRTSLPEVDNEEEIVETPVDKKKSVSTMEVDDIKEEDDHAETPSAEKKKKKNRSILPEVDNEEEIVETPVDKKKKKKSVSTMEVDDIKEDDYAGTPSGEKKKKKKRNSIPEVIDIKVDDDAGTPEEKKKKKKRTSIPEVIDINIEDDAGTPSGEKKKKKKRKSEIEDN